MTSRLVDVLLWIIVTVYCYTPETATRGYRWKDTAHVIQDHEANRSRAEDE